MKNKLLKNKVAIISGSSMGIGEAIANELAKNGAKVVLNGRDLEKLENTETKMKQKGYNVLAIAADVRYPEQCRYLINETIKRYSKIDILVNNAAMSSRGAVEEMAESNFKVLIETNYTGCAYMSKYAIPYLKKTKGHQIFINSVGGLRGMPYNSAYTASKMAQAALADALRIELYDSGIHIGLVYVGFTENDSRKTILDVDGSLVYLPKRKNIHLATQQSVARCVCLMIEKRKNRTVLTGLGYFADFMIQYFPKLSDWIILLNRQKIKDDFTFVEDEKILEIKKRQ
ncbi:SDR family oxidoreductase [Aquimarina celericrescens]|uniref:SDR family oxidoreductase n=1 Tax=Aquimarina celericrescens TaxID=1964542 RepID=A0ABW5ARQ3_9FLAO|nr:SDR family oxidoreductase [Aquimarina celericrescens]